MTFSNSFPTDQFGHPREGASNPQSNPPGNASGQNSMMVSRISIAQAVFDTGTLRSAQEGRSKRLAAYGRYGQIVFGRTQEGHNPGTAIRNGNRVLEVRRDAPIGGDDGPTVGFDLGSVASQIEHRLDTDRHALLELGSRPGLSVVGHLGIFVHLSPDPVTDVFAYDPEPVTMRFALNRVADIAQSGAGLHLSDTGGESLFRSIDEQSGLGRYLADGEGDRRVPVKALENGTSIHRQHITLDQAVVGRNAVHNDVVRRRADAGRITVIAEK